jgi:predicted esterase
MRTLHVETVIHGRVLIEDAAVPVSRGWLIGFHGYGQAADDMLAELRRLNAGGAWSVAAPQALHRFYTRGDERVVASWMTRQDRELAVADNVEYVRRLVESLSPPASCAIVFAGFSQGAAMAYRAAALGPRPAAAVIALAGDMPPEVTTLDAGRLRRQLGRVVIGAGARDAWFSSAKVDADAAVLAAAGVPFDLVRFDGAHEWTDEFRRAASAMLAELA